MRLLYVPLNAQTLAQLRQIAERERHEPREQAAYLLERALEGLAPADRFRTALGTTDGDSGRGGVTPRSLDEQTSAPRPPHVDAARRSATIQLTGDEAGDEPAG